MCELCDKKDEIAQAVRRVQRIQDKVTLAISKFADAAKDQDQGLMDDARLEIHTHYDSLLDLTADVYRLNEEYKDLLLEGPPDEDCAPSGPQFH